MFTLLAARQKRFFKDSPTGRRIVLRVVHCFCRAAQLHLESPRNELLEECPDVSRCSTYHPLLKHSRLRGSTVLKEQVVKRFGKKASGFMKVDAEPTLDDLKVFSGSYRFAGKTSSQFLMRYLVKASGVVQQAVKDAGSLPFVNFCCDAARACTHQVRNGKIRVLILVSLSSCK